MHESPWLNPQWGEEGKREGRERTQKKMTPNCYKVEQSERMWYKDLELSEQVNLIHSDYKTHGQNVYFVVIEK